jgi:predicted nucleic acid-binding protein
VSWARGWRERAVDVWDLVLGVCRVIRLSVVMDLLYGVKLWKGACGRLERRVAELESELGEARLERDEAVRAERESSREVGELRRELREVSRVAAELGDVLARRRCGCEDVAPSAPATGTGESYVSGSAASGVSEDGVGHMRYDVAAPAAEPDAAAPGVGAGVTL